MKDDKCLREKVLLFKVEDLFNEDFYLYLFVRLLWIFVLLVLLIVYKIDVVFFL